MKFLTEKVVPIFLACLILSCSKNPTFKASPTGHRAAPTVLNNYTLMESIDPFNDLIFVNQDPDQTEQELKEGMFYIAYALKEMMQNSSAQLVLDIKSSLDDNNELLVYNFFQAYPQHYSDAQQIIQGDFNMDLTVIVENAVNDGVEDYGYSLYLPEEAINGLSTYPVVAMAVEVDCPDTETILYQGEGEERGNGYCDDDFIPAFHVPSESTSYTEHIIGYDDYHTGSQAKAQIDPITIIIVVGVTAVVLGSGAWAVAWPKQLELNSDLLGSGTVGGQGCEASQVLRCTEARFDVRYQRWKSESRIRYSYGTKYGNSPSYKEFGTYYRIANLNKNEIGTSVFTDLFTLNGFDPTNTTYTRDQPPHDFHFLASTFEYDWYGTKKSYFVEYVDQVSNKNIYISTEQRTARGGEYYQMMLVQRYNWCAFDEKQWNQNGYAHLTGQ